MEKNALSFVLVAALIIFVYSSSGMADDSDFNRYDALFKTAAKKYNIPWEWIKAVAIIESRLGEASSVKRGLENPDDTEGSKSSDGLSWGIMQVTLRTAQELRPGTMVRDLNNPQISIDLGAKYLGKMYTYFLGNEENTIRAYNGGPGWNKSEKGRSMTAVYYSRFKKALDEVKNG